MKAARTILRLLTLLILLGPKVAAAEIAEPIIAWTTVSKDADVAALIASQEKLTACENLYIASKKISPEALSSLANALQKSEVRALKHLNISGSLERGAIANFLALPPVDSLALTAIEGDPQIAFLESVRARTLRVCVANGFKEEHFKAVLRNKSMRNVLIQHCPQIEDVDLAAVGKSELNSLRIFSTEGKMEWTRFGVMNR